MSSYESRFLKINESLKRIAIALEQANEKKKQVRNPVLDGGAQKLVSIWNNNKPFACSSIESLSPSSSRYKNAVARWKEKPSEEYWIGIINRVAISKFCLGDNERGWIADFEFLVRPDTHFKVLEGKYDRCHASFVKDKKKELVLIQTLDDGTPVYDTRKY